MSDNEEWFIVRKIKGMNLEEKVFETSDLPKSEAHEAQIERFRPVIEEMGHEIFKVEGHQFITSDGVYVIVHKDEISFY